jgi:hypothetical protein
MLSISGGYQFFTITNVLKGEHDDACTPVIPVPRRLRQKDLELEAYLGYIVKPFSEEM